MRWASHLLSVTAFATCWSHAASAANPKAECSAAFEDGQRLQRAKKLKVAAERFAFCASNGCPPIMHSECRAFFDKVDASLPTLDLTVLDETGGSLSGARVRIDGGAEQALNGSSLRLDPGNHELVIDADGYSPLLQEISLIAPGVTGVTVQLVRLPTKPTENVGLGQASKSPSGGAAPTGRQPPGSSICHKPLLLTSSAALGAVGGLSAAYFGLSARRGERALRECSPSCAQAAVDEVRRDYTLANVALAVGVIGFAASSLIYLADRPPAPPARTKRSWRVTVGAMNTFWAAF